MFGIACFALELGARRQRGMVHDLERMLPRTGSKLAAGARSVCRRDLHRERTAVLTQLAFSLVTLG